MAGLSDLKRVRMKRTNYDQVFIIISFRLILNSGLILLRKEF
jgi:hypothetical protein